VEADRLERIQSGVDSETKVKELQDLVDFFKRNSERNSKQVRELIDKLNGVGF
jgi:hypothetical protein